MECAHVDRVTIEFYSLSRMIIILQFNKKGINGLLLSNDSYYTTVSYSFGVIITKTLCIDSIR